ncbi:unnamed protein product [Protopolystoma xenopodis]|uniref:Uncharacterized protein n=1 Tax=Protopolystoma xenopodis TaxID=117903 RepID=A0A448WLE5_9PLAT|nr:unnamed protein product [Protopolystoma xenopodis]
MQAAKDFRTQHVSRNIILVQAELARLTAIELDNRQRRTDERSEAAGNALLAARTRLLDLLTQLFEERSKREVELKKRLAYHSKFIT